jgi:sortase A
MDNKPNDFDKDKQNAEAAINIIRGKLDKLYIDEPDATEEIKEVKHIAKSHQSKHQKYMDELSHSGRSLAEIQTAWHEYYQQLSDNEKHQVWREFYSHQQKSKPPVPQDKPVSQTTDEKISAQKHSPPKAASPRPTKTRRSFSNPKEDLLKKVSNQARKSDRRTARAHSLIFGLGVGTVVVFVMMFTFFNERFITPFIRPSVNVSATPIIVDPNSNGPTGPESKIIIPKINIEAPVVYDEPSIEEKAIQKALERGVVHYAITPEPGELGNSVIVGHSSGNILNSGKYKFAFLLLKSLDNEDTFIIQKDSKRYVYKVYKKFVTNPKDISVLDPPADNKKAIMTLITCDPPGLSTNRLIIQAEQIFPSPSENKPPSTNQQSDSKPEELGGNSPSLWSRIINAVFN